MAGDRGIVGRNKMTLHIRNAVFLVFALAAIVAAILVVEYMQSSSFYFRQQRRMVDRVVASDPDRLLSAGRQLLHCTQVDRWFVAIR